MKLHPIIFSALVAVMATPLVAQSARPTTVPTMEKAGSLIGKVVIDGRNERVGKIYELAIDFNAGRVAEILVDTGGYLTSKQRIVAVPPELFKLMDIPGDVRLAADLDTFDNAPEFNKATWKESTVTSSVTDMYKRFKVAPYQSIGNLQPSAAITAAVAKNGNQRLGKVNDIVVTLPDGRIPDLIVTVNNELTAVPPGAFLYQPAQNALQIDTTLPALKNAPHFKLEDWRSAISANLAANNPSTDDAATTLEIERRILTTEGLSMDARRVQVVTEKGRVTLRGMADSDKERLQLGAIAASVAGVEHVDNRVEVRVFALQ